MKQALYLVLILIALSLGYLRWRYRGEDVPITPSPSLSPSPVAATPLPSVAALSQTLNNSYFSLSYDQGSTISARTAPDSREWVLTYLGKAQQASGRTQTELADGYMLIITRYETIGGAADRLQAEADREGTIDTCGADRVSEIVSGSVGAYEALTYYGGCLGQADHYYVMLEDILYRLSVMIVGSEIDKPSYRATVQAILNSLILK